VGKHSLRGSSCVGNIFIREGGKVSLIDCGQFKTLPRPQRVQLAKLVLGVAEFQNTGSAESKRKLADLVRVFGVTFMEGEQDNDDLACAVALVLFGDTGIELPGGYSSNELSEDSPIKLVASFPQELVLMGRATVLIKGIAKRLDIPLSLTERWSEGCQLTVSASSSPTLPLWGKNIVKSSSDASGIATGSNAANDKIRFRQIASLFKDYTKGKGKRLLERTAKRMPPKMRSRFLQYVVERQERLDAATRKDKNYNN
jgi:hypothetical protein